MARTLTISVDFDATYTADPDTFGRMMEVALAAGHRVIVVTGRGDHHAPTAEAVVAERFAGEVPVIRVYHSAANNKFQAAVPEGYDVDVWWDDQPWHIKPSEARRLRDKQLQKMRSRVAREIGKDATFGEYMDALNEARRSVYE